MEYLIMFALSLFFIYLGLSSSSKPRRITCFIIGLALPCLMAGLRDVSVGTDTGGYALSIYEKVSEHDSIFSFLTNSYVAWAGEPGYNALTYCVARVFGSFNAVLLVIQILIMVPLFIALYINRTKKEDVMLGMTLFYLFSYNYSLNMMKQSVALSFALLAFSLFMNAKTKKGQWASLLFIVIGVLFHRSALVSVLIFVIYRLFCSDKISDRMKKTFRYLIIITCIAAVVFYKPILTFVGKSGIFKSALYYLKEHSISQFDLLGNTVNITILLAVYLGRKAYKKTKLDFSFVSLTAIMNVILYGITTFVLYSSRIVLYFKYPLMYLMLPSMSLEAGENKKPSNRKLAVILLLITVLVYWFWQFLISNRSETIPYKTFWM